MYIHGIKINELPGSMNKYRVRLKLLICRFSRCLPSGTRTEI